jgi:hypothetical protein
VGGLSSSAYVGDKSESSEMKRGCNIAIGNSCNLALAVDNLAREYMHALIGTPRCCHFGVEVENFTYVACNLAVELNNLAKMRYAT